MSAVRAAIVSHGMDAIDIPQKRAIEGAGLAKGNVIITRKCAVTVDGKRKTANVPFMVLPINDGHRFPTRFKAEKVYDEHGAEKVDKRGNVIRKKRGFQSFFNACIKTALDVVIFEAFHGRGLYAATLDAYKVAD